MSKTTFWIGVVAGLAMLATLALTLVSPGIFYPIGDSVQLCEACRIFYFHVPSAWIAYLAFLVVFVSSVAYLRTSNRRWDALARSSAEVGVIMTTITLVSGSLWGRPVWGTWWTWDARLTTTLILWFIYVAYLMLRAYVSEEERAARYTSVLGILGFVAVPINYFSVTLWRTLHPQPVVLRLEGPAAPDYMIQILLVGLLGFTLLYVYLVRERMRLEHLQSEVRNLRVQAVEASAASRPGLG